jgi:hypothetical protein
MMLNSKAEVVIDTFEFTGDFRDIYVYNMIVLHPAFDVAIAIRTHFTLHSEQLNATHLVHISLALHHPPYCTCLVT